MTPAEAGRAKTATPKPLPYTRNSAQGADVWDVVREADAGEEAGSVRLLYSGYDIPAGKRDSEYASGWTREHVWPRSRGSMTIRTPGRGTDAHNIFAADASVNSSRSDRHFCDLPEGKPVVDWSPAPGKDGRLLARASEDSWEPPDVCKGVVARALMYMACVYGEDLRLVDRKSEGAGEVGVLSDVLRWNEAYPPGPCERLRNDVVARFQGNRNPFIDDPSLARLVAWDIQ
jgi:endonuclease I